MVIKCIHKKYGGRKLVKTDMPTYVIPRVYLSKLEIKDNQINLNESTLNQYKQLMKMGCEKIILGWDIPDFKTKRMIYKNDGELILDYTHEDDTNTLEYFINNQYIKWNNIKVKVGSNAELMYAVQLDTGQIIFVLYTIRVRIAQ